MKRWAWIPAVVLALAGCAAPYDGDGETGAARGAIAGTANDPDAMPVVVDTDLAPDDLIALAFMLRRTDVSVEAVTVAATGLVGCDPGVDLVADLVALLGEPPVPISCGRAEPGPGGRSWPADWVDRAADAAGLPESSEYTLRALPQRAPALIAQLADQHDGALTVLAIGPLTNLADLAEQWPASYARLAGIRVMGGALDLPAVDGVTEWNAGADPEAFAAVLAEASVPVTIVPDDPIPAGTPAAVAESPLGVLAALAGVPKWWDTTTAATLVAPDAVTARRGSWEVDGAGTLRRTGAGTVAVVSALDQTLIEAAFEDTFGRPSR